ncbi:ParB/RepB/Spo0J family partition protein [bacterium]|nr:ParB/RepB/Spo0J family partition protein [bacterium]MBU1652033.1 ParB/RepB/Spo0J family partition protein [bacterium]MBU1881229.1 ParB/RepB/Spo0J family partition protein [bacterium]
MSSKESRLGKGLAALLPKDIDLGGRAPQFAELELDQIRMNPEQPRRQFDEQGLQDLAASIKAKGVVQPIIVRKVEEGFELVAGERRLRAAKLAGLTRIPVFIAQVADGAEMLELALIENLQREDLNAMEMAEGFHRLANEYELTQEQISERVGKSRTAVANTIRLVKLPRDVQNSLRNGQITEGHARAILAFDDRERQIALWKKIVRGGLSVRKAEQLTRTIQKPSAPLAPPPPKPAYVTQIEERLRNLLGTHVRLQLTKGKGGKIEIEFYNDEDLDRLLELFDLMEKGW